MIILPEKKEFQIKDSLQLSPIGIKISSEELKSWFIEEYGWENPEIHLCVGEDGDASCIMCSEEDDGYFERNPQFKDILIKDDEMRIS